MTTMLFKDWPTHCYSCGVVLLGGATRHHPTCQLVEENIVVECTCRDRRCGHPASYHRGERGTCLVCERDCWC